MWQNDDDKKAYFRKKLLELVEQLSEDYPEILITNIDDHAIDNYERRKRKRDLSGLGQEALTNLKQALDENFISLEYIRNVNIYYSDNMLRLRWILSDSGVSDLRDKLITFKNAMEYNPAMLAKILSKEGLKYINENHIDLNNSDDVFSKFDQENYKNQRLL